MCFFLVEVDEASERKCPQSSEAPPQPQLYALVRIHIGTYRHSMTWQTLHIMVVACASDWLEVWNLYIIFFRVVQTHLWVLWFLLVERDLNVFHALMQPINKKTKKNHQPHFFPLFWYKIVYEAKESSHVPRGCLFACCCLY